MSTTASTTANAPVAQRAAELFCRRPVLWMSAVLIAAVAAVRPEIVSATNLKLLLMSTALLSLVTIGQLFVLITAGIDLSVPAVMSLTSVAGATVLTAASTRLGPVPSVALAVTAMIGLGAIVGALHGWAVSKLTMPAFLVTLASLIGVGGAAVLWTKSARIPVNEQFVEIWYGRLLGVPTPLICAVCVALASHWVLSRTVMGRRLFALGHSEETCRVSGTPIVLTTVFAYATSGCLASAAAVLYTARLYTGSPQLVETDLLLDCIGGAVIGGASLFGGRGKVSGAILGAFFIALLGNSLNLLGLRHWHVIMVKGTVILLAALLDRQRSRLELSD